MKTLLVTGGCGFIGTNFVNYLFNKIKYNGIILNLDKLTYAGNPENLRTIEKDHPENYNFIHGDISDKKLVRSIFKKYSPDCIINFAAESHVDRSILDPSEFIHSNIIGTFTLLEVARDYWQDNKDVLFHHISTDEVFGSLNDKGFFYENTPYDPRSPYSASKASADHLVMAYFHTYGIPVTISNCSNNYGPYQFPEKLIPLMISNMIEDKHLPIYGDGKNIRDWLYVEDHCAGIWEIIKNGTRGETYNIGGENEIRNIDLINILCEKMSDLQGENPEFYKKLITYVKDRPGHDWRYAINMDKIKRELNFQPSVNFEEGITKTIQWYLDNPNWIKNIKSGEYQNWINKNYGDR